MAVLLPPQYAKPYVERGKNAAADAHLRSHEPTAHAVWCQ
jgi:hypothetical protein